MPPPTNAESIRRLIELGNQLTKGLTNVMDHQSYMRQREDLHASSTSRPVPSCGGGLNVC